ncbi:MAG: hypothetical protein D3916_01875 [Candidatus Electrothrix sp. MAN1_4]|nr:hypothetical protein [Candidatus Electrothrix sp. MAN1_4]
MGGIGKTEIAKEVCHIFHETWQEHPDLPENLIDLLGQKEGGFFRDSILWIQFHPEGQTPKSLTDDLISLLIKQCPMVGKEIKNLDTLADVLAGKDVLAVLDNVEQNLRTFDYVLECFKGCFPLLITSRIAIPGIKSIDIDVFTDKDAETLFLRHINNPQLAEEERKTVRELCKLLGNYPLLIKIIASQVKADNSNLTELLEIYKKNRKSLLDQCNDSSGINPLHSDVRTCFMMSFKGLDEKEQRVFCYAALFDNSFFVEALAVLLHNVDVTEVGHIVNSLEHLSLINCLHHGRDRRTTYELHPLMREFALDSLMQTVEIIPGRKEENEILLKELQQAKKEEQLPEQLKKTSFVQDIVDAVQYCDKTFDFAAVLQFMQVLDGQLDSLNCWNERLLLNRLAIRAAVALQQDFTEGIYRKQYADVEKQQAIFKSKFDFVGRKKELAYFEDNFLFYSDSFILNLHTNGDGGFGKTKLLQKMLELCRSTHLDKVISSDELIDFYYTEARSKAGIIEQIINKLGIDHFSNVIRQLEKYRRTKDSSERQYLLDDAVTALRKDYAVFAALSERAGKIIILFFDTYEVIQFIGKEENTVERSDFSEWLEKELFPALQADNTRLVIAGRYPLINAAKGSVVTTELSLFEYKEAVDFLLEYLKVAEFSPDEYQHFLGDFPQAEHLLQPFQYNLGSERIGVRMYEFPNGYRKELGEDVWQALQNKVPVKKEEKLLDTLKLTQDELKTVIELARRRPIYLALFMDWVRFSKAEPSKLVRAAWNIKGKDAQRELFENTVVEWLWNDPDKRKYIYYMTVAYRRMTAEIMQHLTGDSPEHCQEILLEDIRHFSFTKYKKDEIKGDIVLLHDEMRDLIKKRWQGRIDPDREQKKEILVKLIHYYKEELLSPNYVLTDVSCSQSGQGNILKGIVDKVKNIKSFFFTKDDFLSTLETKLTKDELNRYSPVLVKAARQEVLQERREVYTPELIEYAFMADADNGVQRFCEEFDTAIEDGRVAYAGLLGREAEFCCKKYSSSSLVTLEVELRDVQHYIEGNEGDISQALDVITKVNERQKDDASWEFSLLFGKFKLWEGIVHFWLDDFDKAIIFLKKARGVFIVHEGQEDLMFLAENWIGYTYYRKADFVEAESWMKKSLNGLLALLKSEVTPKTRKKRNIQQHIQYAYGNLAMLYRYTGIFAESIQYSEVAHSIVESLPRNQKEMFRSLNTMTHVLAVAGRSMDARAYLGEAKKIYKEIPDPLLGGRLHSNYCWLAYDSLEAAFMLEYYRATDLRDAINTTFRHQSGRRVKQLKTALENTEKAVKILEGESDQPISHKELADAYFNLGGLYIMIPEAQSPDKWSKAEQAYLQAAESAKESQFRYTYIDTLESLVTLYYFWNRAAESLSEETRAANEHKLQKYQEKLERLQPELKRYPSLMGRYKLTLGDIEFDNALDRLEEKNTDDADHTVEVKLLQEAFKYYFSAIEYKRAFNRDRYFLGLQVCYNRLIKLIREQRFVAERILAWMQGNPDDWQYNFSSFKDIFDYIVLLHITEENRQETIDRLKQIHQQVEDKGDYRYAVLLNKCLIDGYRLQARITQDENYLLKLVCRLNRQSQSYRLLGDVHHTRLCYERARNAIQGNDIEAKIPITDAVLQQGLEGYTDIVEGEFYFRRGEYGSLSEIFLKEELSSARERFDNQFKKAREKAFTLLKQGKERLDNTLKQLEKRLQSPENAEQKEFLEKRYQFYHRLLADAYFQLGELLMMNGHFQENEQDGPGAFEYLRKSITKCEDSQNYFRHDDAVQSYLNAIYFSGVCDDWDAHKDVVIYKQKLEEKIKSKDYKYPWVAARFRITQGDVLFSRCFTMEEQPVETDSENYRFVPKETPVRREDLLRMFSYYVDACNYKAGFNDLSFEAGLRVLRRRIELIADSSSLDILHDILRHIWQDGAHLRRKSEELESILQLIRMRCLTRKLVQEYER